MKKVRAVGMLVLVFVAGLMIGLYKNVKPDQLKVYARTGETVTIEFPDGNIYSYN